MREENVTICVPLSAAVNEKKVRVKDLILLTGKNKELTERISEKVIYEFSKDEERVIISSITLVSMLESAFPEITVNSEGETNVIIKYKPKPAKIGKLFDYLKVAFVSLAIFFGSAFTIMTFNSDVDVAKVFEEVYNLTSYSNPEGKLLEISYSIGIFLGIMLFFNHITKKKEKADPTPVKVQMLAYEKGVNETVIQEAMRDGEVL